jgi:hypothetical protein
MMHPVDPRRAAISDLVTRVPRLKMLLAECVVENFGDLIPTLFIADLIPWLLANHLGDPESVAAVLDWMEQQLASGNEQVRGMIVTSGIDDLTAPGQAGAVLRPLLGPLTASIDPWSFTS